MVAIDWRLLADDGLGSRISGEVKGWHDDLNSFQASYRQKEGAPSCSWALPAVLAIGVQHSQVRHACRSLPQERRAIARSSRVSLTCPATTCFRLSTKLCRLLRGAPGAN